MFLVKGFELDGEIGLVQLLDLALREVVRSFGDAVVDPSTTDLRGSQYKVLSMVPVRGGRRLSDLATIADMTKQAMGEFVADLASEGYVRVAPDPTDRRAKLVSLTAKGQRASERARAMLAAVEALWVERLGARDAETLQRLLARVAGIT
jgi:DNA-binding MarR family transcriptional regulator